MADKGHSERNIFGGYTHYDEHGKKIGTSEPDLFGGFTDYDSSGKKIGHTDRGLFGDYHHYDSHGKKTGTSSPGLFGGYTDYDSHGKKVGSSDPGLFGGYIHYGSGGSKSGGDSGNIGGYSRYDLDEDLFAANESSQNSGSSGGEGCYIATCVYGSYDCPEVWTLRRFRDRTLKRFAAGRAFVRIYYAVSPSLVRRFGGAKPFRKFCRGGLDRLVSALNGRGVKDTPYKDA